MGLNLLDKDGTLIEGKIPDIPQFLNRLLSLKTDMQNAVFDEFESRLVEAVEYARQHGVYDEGLQTLRALNITKTRDEVVHTHKTSAETRYIELDVTNAVEYLQWEDVTKMARQQALSEGEQKSLSGWFVSEHGKSKGDLAVGERCGSVSRKSLPPQSLQWDRGCGQWWRNLPQERRIGFPREAGGIANHGVPARLSLHGGCWTFR
jgi:hypothetical protein